MAIGPTRRRMPSAGTSRLDQTPRSYEARIVVVEIGLVADR